MWKRRTPKTYSTSAYSISLHKRKSNHVNYVEAAIFWSRKSYVLLSDVPISTWCCWFLLFVLCPSKQNTSIQQIRWKWVAPHDFIYVWILSPTQFVPQSVISWNRFFFLHLFDSNLQKEDKIRLLRQRLVEREAAAKSNSGQTAQLTTETQLIAATNLAQGKDALIIIAPDPITASDFDSAIGGGFSIMTRSSRASQSDVEFSESYL